MFIFIFIFYMFIVVVGVGDVGAQTISNYYSGDNTRKYDVIRSLKMALTGTFLIGPHVF